MALLPTLEGERQNYQAITALEGMCGSYTAVADDGTLVFAKTFEQLDDKLAQKLYNLERSVVPRVSAKGVTPEIIDLGKHNCLIVQEYVHGLGLDRVLDNSGRKNSDETRRVLSPILRRAEQVHHLGIIHRDLKPANVLIPLDGGELDYERPYLIDFGLARDKNTDDVLSHSAGTLEYLSPEQLNGSASDERSDIYAAGIMAYELLMGRTPETYDLDVSSAAYEEYLLFRKAAGPIVVADLSIDRRLRDAIQKATEPRADKRFQSLAEMDDAINRKSIWISLGDLVAKRFSKVNA